LSRVKENGKPLLDSTIVLYGSAINDGNRHNHDDLPILVAGGRGKRGRIVASAPGTPLCNLHVGIARAAGVKVDRFGDANGTIEA
jgi:hypothetical protein